MTSNPVFDSVRDLGAFIREQRTSAQISLRALATKAGVSNPYLSQVERGLRKPSAEILAQIAQGLSISVETLLTKAGILTGQPSGEVVGTINADPYLSERQKAALIEIYRAFRAEHGIDVAPDGDAAGTGSVDPVDPADPVDHGSVAAEPPHRRAPPTIASPSLGDGA